MKILWYWRTSKSHKRENKHSLDSVQTKKNVPFLHDVTNMIQLLMNIPNLLLKFYLVEL